MATNVSDMPTHSKTKTATVSAADIEHQVEKLRGEIGELTRSVAQYGADMGEKYRDKAGQSVEDLRLMSEDAFDTVRAEIGAVAKGTRKQISRNPVQAVALAAGVGFLAALLLRK